MSGSSSSAAGSASSSSATGVGSSASAPPPANAVNGAPAVAANHIDPSASSSSSAAASSMAANQVLDRKRMQELVKEVDPYEQLDEDVEDLLLHIADDFIEQTVTQAAQLAKHRRAASIDVRDVQLVLGRSCLRVSPNIVIVALESPNEKRQCLAQTSINYCCPFFQRETGTFGSLALVWKK